MKAVKLFILAMLVLIPSSAHAILMPTYEHDAKFFDTDTGYLWLNVLPNNPANEARVFLAEYPDHYALATRDQILTLNQYTIPRPTQEKVDFYNTVGYYSRYETDEWTTVGGYEQFHGTNTEAVLAIRGFYGSKDTYMGEAIVGLDGWLYEEKPPHNIDPVFLTDTGIDSWGRWVTDGGYYNNLATNPQAETPEPATLALLGMGLLGLAGVKRKAIS